MINTFARCFPVQIRCALGRFIGAFVTKRLISQRMAFSSFKNMDILPIPALEDNYMYLLIDRLTKEAAVVDPVEPKKILLAAEKAHANIKAVITTHHHGDHSGGNADFKQMLPTATVYGGDERIPALDKLVKHDDKFEIGSLKVRCLFTPCHTKGHICYFVESSDPNDPPAVFTGDTLFIAGCGRFFEGTAEQMHKALVETLGKLPQNTRIYCGHEYTLNNLLFAQHAEPDNANIKTKLAWAMDMKKQKQFTVPSTIKEELETNPFMRVNQRSLLAHTNAKDAIDCMRILRQEKDNFKTKAPM